MARTTEAKAAGLDLLDRLFRNQILVHLVLSGDEREWLARLKALVDKGANTTGIQGVEAERLRHWTYCLLEILVADHHGSGLERMPGAPPLPSNLSMATVQRIAEFERVFFAGLALGFGESIGGSAATTVRAALDLAEGLVEDFRGAPAVVRLRLAERALAFEFPEAPLEALQWLASVGILRPAKFSARPTTEPVSKAVAVRAASIYEFETIRGLTRILAGDVKISKASQEKFVQRMQSVSEKDANDVDVVLLDMQRAEARLRQPGNLFALALCDPQWCFAPESASRFLAKCHQVTPYMRTSLHKQSTALTDIAAAIARIRKTRSTPSRALYAVDSKRGTIADDVAELLCARGFEVHPKTIHRHLLSRMATPVHVQTFYREAVSQMGIAWPAHWPDFIRPFEVAISRVMRPDMHLKSVDSDSVLH